MHNVCGPGKICILTLLPDERSNAFLLAALLDREIKPESVCWMQELGVSDTVPI